MLITLHHATNSVCQSSLTNFQIAFGNETGGREFFLYIPILSGGEYIRITSLHFQAFRNYPLSIISVDGISNCGGEGKGKIKGNSISL